MVDETKKDQKTDNKKTDKQDQLPDTDLDDASGGRSTPMPVPMPPRGS